MAEAEKQLALISVYDKSGVVDLAQTLVKNDFEILSTGGTAKVLEAGGIKVTRVEDYTGFPECLDGRVKTLHPKIAAGLLADRNNPKHVEESTRLGSRPISMVVCNLYPFAAISADPNTTLKQAVENIDIGGVTLMRAGAKNFENVAVVSDPKYYDGVIQAVEQGSLSIEERKRLAMIAFRKTGFYDTLVSRYLGRQLENKEEFPDEQVLPLAKIFDLRYGENPHQRGVVYCIADTYSPMRNLNWLTGRSPSLVNVTDINAGIESVRLFKEPAAVVIKHNNPCGLALGANYSEALHRAIDGDPESAFGGVVVLNGPMDLDTARVIADFKNDGFRSKGQMDIVAVPEISDDALAILKGVRRSTGVFTFGKIPDDQAEYNYKWIDGGVVKQTADLHIEDSFDDWKVVSGQELTPNQRKLAQFGWLGISRMKSNTIGIVDGQIPTFWGIGSGQTSRIRSTKLALELAGDHSQGGMLISDSFFPFSDWAKPAKDAGISIVIQQGGSVNDKMSIEAARDLGMTMILTGRWAFSH